MSEKSLAAQLKEELFINRKNGALLMSDEEIRKADEFSEGYKRFINIGKTERLCVKEAIRLAKENGFEEFVPGKKYNAGDRVYVNNRGKALMLAVMGKKGVKEGVKLAIAHVDSPRLDLKPNPMYEASDLALFKTHYYGGIKKYQWTAIPLALHGTVLCKGGRMVDVSIGENEDEPCFCVTDLLPHLGREQMQKTGSKIIEGENLNILIGSRPFRDDKESELVKLNILKILKDKYNIKECDFLTSELEAVPAFKARDIGFDRSMIGAYGHDDRVCAYPALMAALGAKTPENTVISVLTDKEETGSDGNTGMQSKYMMFFIKDLAMAEGCEVHHVLHKSKCLSADVNAAFDPTYSSAYEANNSSYINNGVVITKYTGSGGKGGTNDASAEFMSEIREMLDNGKVIWQIGELGKVDGGGGGTIAKYVANLDVDTVDLGVPVLSMHAPYEIISKIDIYMAFRAFEEFYK
ncbi:MAG: aminopeptidase [Clostridiales bacterium]|nr:aminopeptidase [Clostridiales bacterium]